MATKTVYTLKNIDTQEVIERYNSIPSRIDIPANAITILSPSVDVDMGGYILLQEFVDEPDPPPEVTATFDGAVFLARLTDDEYGAIISASMPGSNTQWRSIARWLDIFRLRGEIDVTGSTTLTAKAGLVSAGLLTQERADVIFAAG